jgi:hypothetical protein
MIVRTCGPPRRREMSPCNTGFSQSGTADADPHGPKLKIRGHSVQWSAARIPADVCQTLIKQTMSDDSNIYFSLLNKSQNKIQKKSLKDHNFLYDRELFSCQSNRI